MDLCLNITSQPIATKKIAEHTSTIKPKPVKTNSGSFDLTWDKNKSVKAAFVKKKNVSKTTKKLQENTRKPPVENVSDSFDFKWEINKKMKPAFVKKKLQKNATKPTDKGNNMADNVIKIDDKVKTNTVINNNTKMLSAVEEKTTKTFNIQNKIKSNSNLQTFANLENIGNATTISSDDENDSDLEVVETQSCINNNKNKTNLNESNGKPFKRKVFPLFDHFSKVSKIRTNNNEMVTPALEQMFSKDGKTFKDLNIHPHIITNLERAGLTVLTTVQEKTIPEVMSGKNVFVRSQTGSGKTLAYAIPVVETLQRVNPHISRQDGVQVVVVVPTHELVLQTYELFLKLVEPFRWIVPGRLCGGEKRSSEKARLRKGITVLIGTPGRLLDHVLHTRNLKLDKVRCLVLDEADRLLDMGFQIDINTIIEQIDQAQNIDYDPLSLLKSKGSIASSKSNRQTILLSATLTSNVKDLAKFTMVDYIYIDPLTNATVDPDQIHLAARREIVIPESVKQKYVVTDVKARLVLLSAFMVEKLSNKSCKMLIFMASKQMVEYHEMLFKKCLLKRRKKEGRNDVVIMFDDDDDADVMSEEEEDLLDVEFFKLHGSMEQKERVQVFKKFRTMKKGILFCTDVAARGIDIPNADYVVQYTGPLQDQDYIHRVGRTGRAGHTGYALLFLTEPELQYITHLKEKKFHLTRVKQEKILQSLVSFMEHASPNSAEAAAEILQKRFEKAVLEDNELHKAACLAFSSWSRYYSSYPACQKQFFDFHKAHLGHYVTSFALRRTPQEVARYVRTKRDVIAEKRLNKKLANHEVEENSVKTPAKPKKRKRAEDLVVSEYDSGLTPIKKKKKI